MASVAEREIVIPYARRVEQRAIHDALDRTRWVVAVCHRRMGKTVCAVNHLIRAAATCTKPRPRYAYIAPTYRQGKATAWDYFKHFTASIPGISVNESELRIDLPTGGQVRIYGADNPDALRGIYLDGAVLDEYGLMAMRLYAEVIRPLLADREGWALLLGTPNGKNQLYDAACEAKRNPEWAFLEFKASQTNILKTEELRAARAVMTPDQYQQEFECSFEASVQGAIYAREVASAREQGRITKVPYDPMLKVDTDWDLGIGDATAIWFSQSTPGGEIRLIDYYEASGMGLQHYVDILSRRGYTYGTHWAPHDIQVRELTSGHARIDAARSLGLYFQITPKVERIEDRIHAGRMLFPRCWFDRDLCEKGIETLQHYRWDFNTRIQEFTALPVHDWASHGADAFGGLAYRHYTPSRHPERQAAAETRKAQRDTDPWTWGRPRGRRGGY